MKPIKALTYFYGADKKLPLPSVDHDCDNCNLPNCKFKKRDIVNVIEKDGERQKLTNINKRPDIS